MRLACELLLHQPHRLRSADPARTPAEERTLSAAHSVGHIGFEAYLCTVLASLLILSRSKHPWTTFGQHIPARYDDHSARHGLKVPVARIDGQFCGDGTFGRMYWSSSRNVTLPLPQSTLSAGSIDSVGRSMGTEKAYSQESRFPHSAFTGRIPVFPLI